MSRSPLGLRPLVWQVVLAGALLLVPLAAGGAAGSSTTRVVVKVGDEKLTVSTRNVPAGTVVFIVKNVGAKPHAFSVAGKSTGVLRHGRSATLVVHFLKGGKYVYRVTLFRGRSGTISVTTPKSGGIAAGSAQLAAGKAIFKSAGCGNCHVLQAAGASGNVGPNLDKLKLTLSKIVGQVTQGGRFMPPFGAAYGGSLSATQIKDVAAFVYAAEH